MTIEHPLKIYEKLDPELLKFVENSSDFVSPAPTPVAQASQEAPGFEMVFGIIGVLVV